MSSAATRNCTLAALLVAVPALAETFHSRDGVVFEGTLRRVVPQAAVCNVLEQNHTPDEYERLKGNHGRGVDLWQVDFAVRNESGRQIEHLRSSGWVRAEHPPCTNWSGEGPGGGPLLPQPGLLLPVVWSDYYQMLQRADGMRPGEQERRSLYLVVFEEHQPRFGEWDIDYRFAAGGGGTTQRGQGPQTPSPAFALPPEIQADRYLRQAEQAVRSGDGKSARAAMERLEVLQQEHGLEPKPEDHYRYAEAWEAAGEPERAMAAAARYLQLEGREAEHYTAALDLMNRAEFGEVRLSARPAEGESKAADAARQPFRPGPEEPSCEGQERGTSCWMELENHRGCYSWSSGTVPGWTVTWSGECAGGLASGTGTLTFVRDGNEAKFSGLLRDGKKHGRWVLSGEDGRVHEGPYVDGKKHGDWVERFADGGGAEGSWVGGKRHGRWVIRESDGTVREGPYVDGKRHGYWVFRFDNGSVREGPYVDGEMHGRWIVRFPNGTTEPYTMVNGKRQ